MAPQVLESMLHTDKDKLVSIISLLSQSLAKKDLQLYFFDSPAQKQLEDFGWQNQVKQTDNDYLMVVDSNIAGQKTDQVIKQTIFHEATVLPSGRVRDKVTILRQHDGIEGELFYGVRNVNYMRIYVPQGSKIISASGFFEPAAELFGSSAVYQQDQDLLKISGITKTDPGTKVKINDEFGKTVFAGWTQTDPGDTSKVVLEYELPFTISFARYQTGWDWVNQLEEKMSLTEKVTSYSLLAQKQSGIESELYSFVDFPADWQRVWQYPSEELKVATGGLQYSHYLDRDRIYSVMFKK